VRAYMETRSSYTADLLVMRIEASTIWI